MQISRNRQRQTSRQADRRKISIKKERQTGRCKGKIWKVKRLLLLPSATFDLVSREGRSQEFYQCANNTSIIFGYQRFSYYFNMISDCRPSNRKRHGSSGSKDLTIYVFYQSPLLFSSVKLNPWFSLRVGTPHGPQTKTECFHLYSCRPILLALAACQCKSCNWAVQYYPITIGCLPSIF